MRGREWRQRISSELHVADSTEPNEGLELTNRDTMTWTEAERWTDWATGARRYESSKTNPDEEPFVVIYLMGPLLSGLHSEKCMWPHWFQITSVSIWISNACDSSYLPFTNHLLNAKHLAFIAN